MKAAVVQKPQSSILIEYRPVPEPKSGEVRANSGPGGTRVALVAYVPLLGDIMLVCCKLAAPVRHPAEGQYAYRCDHAPDGGVDF